MTSAGVSVGSVFIHFKINTNSSFFIYQSSIARHANSHAFGVLLILTRLEEVFSRILPFSIIIIFITSNHTHLIDVTPIKLINFNEY